MPNSASTPIADESKAAAQSFFEQGVAVDVIAKTVTRKDNSTFVKPLALIRTKFKPEGAESWEESQWFKRHQVESLRDLCDDVLAEMNAIAPEQNDEATAEE